MSIKFIITGGTIDDLDYELAEDMPINHKSLIPGLLEQARLTLKCTVDELMQKDSRHISEDDREVLYNKCLECPEDKIIITHGTTTMPETAKYLGRKNIPKTIVLTGAMIPVNKENSDAFFNLGTAIITAQLLTPGVYITMNGRIFSWNKVRKDFKKGVFKTE